MIDEFRLAYLLQRAHDVRATPETAWRWLEAGRNLVPEAAHHEVTWSYEPMDPHHVAFTSGIRALRVVVESKVVLDEGRPTLVDAAEIRARANEQAQRLHERL